MIRLLFTFIFSLLLIPLQVGFAQTGPQSTKTYVGYFHSNKKGGDDAARKCFVEFRSPVSFADQQVTEVPKSIAYFIRFENDRAPDPRKYTFTMYTDDGQSYTLDTQAEGNQIGLDQAHHIFDSYLIYVILSSKIDYIEVTGGNNQGKYILDKFEISQSS